MDEIEIKEEVPSLDHQCRVCLSVGRKLSPLGKYTDVFKRIIADIDYHNHDIIESVKLCWECVAVLRRVHTFLQRARSAQQTLHSAEFVYGSSSSLAAIILNDTHAHTVYVYEPCVRLGSKCEGAPSPHTDHIDHSDHGGDDAALGDECGDDVKSEELPVPVPVTTEPKKAKNNRWATKRALQNKKPKFKIITDYTEDCFNKIQIKNENVLSYLQSERDSEYFKSKKFKCSQCVRTFIDEKYLNEHVFKYHDKLAPLCCDVCGARVRSKRRLRAHVCAHYRRYACALCAFSCRERARRGEHARRVHNRVFQCLKCELKFGSRKEFFKHYKEWHERFICEHCGVSFKMRYCIKNHLRKQHSPFECKPCNKRFARYNGLWLHNKTTHPASALPTPAYCVECDRRYPDVYRYRWHLANSARHNRTNKVRVACPGCDKVFSKNIYMKDHYNLVHLKHYKYRCEQCDKNFIRNAELVKHRRRVHEGVLPPKNKICCMCGRGFSTNKILMNHVRTHTGERPHACSVCGARFAQRTTLAAHHRAIHRKQP